jgi:hypothetical protein
MSEQTEQIQYFATPLDAPHSAKSVTAVVLPFALEDLLAEWGRLRGRMIRRASTAFSRDEWAYLISFLDPKHLRAAFMDTFGAKIDSSTGADAVGALQVRCLARPRGLVALWLPNNVSLLGPLTLILLTLTGNPIRVKGGSRAEDLVSAFLSYVDEAMPESWLAAYLRQHVRHEVFDRQDARNAAMAAEARVRIVFGGDETAQHIHALPHPVDSVGFSFSDRRSEVWLEASAINDEALVSLIKVFMIYGQAGCTSPGRVVLLDQPRAAAVALRDRLLERWPQAHVRAVAPHLASENIMARQWAAAFGWDARLAGHNHAVLAVGDYELRPVPSLLCLPIVAASLDEALAHMPHNIQTVGHAVAEPASARWLRVVARTGIKRFVPIERMHHFGIDWDGVPFWQQAFEIVEIGAHR